MSDTPTVEKDAPDFVCCVIGCDAEATVLSSPNEDYFCDEHDPDVEKDVRIPATGNGTKSHDLYDTYLTITGGDGNTNEPEVHLLMEKNDGSEFAQAWFLLSDIQAALSRILPPAETEHQAANNLPGNMHPGSREQCRVQGCARVLPPEMHESPAQSED